MEHTNIVDSPLIGLSGGKLDREVVKKVLENLPLTSANKRRLKKLESLHGAGFWSDFGTGFKKGIHEGLDVVSKVADVGVKLAPLAPLLMAGSKDLEKAKESLKNYVNRQRKTMPSKKHLKLLEEHGIISKQGGNVFKDIGKATKSVAKATEKATKSAIKSTAKASKSAVKYVGDHEQDIRNVVKNPIVKGVLTGATTMVAPELTPLVGMALSAAGKPKKKASDWVQFALAYAKQHNLKYSEALKQAGPVYKKMKGGASYNMAV
jgi:hypothetical protein